MANLLFVVLAIAASVGLLVILKVNLKNQKFCEFLSKNEAFFHPNSISGYGLFCTGASLMCLLLGNIHVAIIFYAISSFLDGADGSIARECDMKTRFGESFDPLCDKLRYGPFLIVFAFHFLSLTPFLIFCFLELLGQSSRPFIEKLGLCSVGANWFGKTKTVLTDVFVAYCFVLYLESWFPNHTTIFLSAIIILSICSIVFKFVSWQETVAKLRNCLGIQTKTT